MDGNTVHKNNRLLSQQAAFLSSPPLQILQGNKYTWSGNPCLCFKHNKGNCAIWSCRLSGLLHCRWLRGSSALEKQPPLSPCRRLSGRVFLPARYFCCILLLIQLHSCTAVLFLNIPREFQGFSNPSWLWIYTAGESASCWLGYAADF